MDQNQRPRVVLVNRCFIVNPDKQILIVRRSDCDSKDAGKWEVPGGKLDEGQDLTNALELEFLEETGLLVGSTNRNCFVESYVIGEGKYVGLPYVVIFSIAQPIGGDIRLSDEHQDYRWVDYKQLMNDFNLVDSVRKAAIVLKTHLC
jgi:8-oxo-dGTP diphosphatase